MRSAIFPLLLRLEPADQQFHLVTCAGKNAPRRKEMLHGQNFGGRHQGNLITIFDRDRGRLQRHNRLSAAHIALQQAVHGGGLLQIGGNFGQNSFLRVRGFEGQNALQRLPHARLAHSERDPRMPLRFLPAQGNAELVKKQFLEDQAPVCRRLELIQQIHRHICRRKMNEADGIAAVRKAIALK